MQAHLPTNLLFQLEGGFRSILQSISVSTEQSVIFTNATSALPVPATIHSFRGGRGENNLKGLVTLQEEWRIVKCPAYPKMQEKEYNNSNLYALCCCSSYRQLLGWDKLHTSLPGILLLLMGQSYQCRQEYCSVLYGKAPWLSLHYNQTIYSTRLLVPKTAFVVQKQNL